MLAEPQAQSNARLSATIARIRTILAFLALVISGCQLDPDAGEHGLPGIYSARYDETEDETELELGPAAAFARLRTNPSRRDFSFLTVPLLGMSLLEVKQKQIESSVKLGPHPLTLMTIETHLDSQRLQLGPFGWLLDIDHGPDRFAIALTPLVLYETRGSFERLRLFFFDLYRRDPEW